MIFKCKCNMRQVMVGDGCDICNTEESFDHMLSPSEVSSLLKNEGNLTDDQASYIASEVYQPLFSMIKVLSNKIDQLSKKVK